MKFNPNPVSLLLIYPNPIFDQMWRSSFRATRRRLRGYSERNTKGRYVALGTGVAVLGVGYSFFKYQERELGKKLILVLEDLSENARKHHFMIRNGGLHLLLLLAHDPMYCSNGTLLL